MGCGKTGACDPLGSPLGAERVRAAVLGTCRTTRSARHWYDCALSRRTKFLKNMSGDRKEAHLFGTLSEAEDGGYMPGTPAQRLSEVWELTREAWFFLDPTGAEQRLQRDVAVLKRRGG